MNKIRVTIWNEFIHEQSNEVVKAIYPEGIHSAIADGLSATDSERFEIQTATLQDPENGLTTDRLATTDVLIWWGHSAHDQVPDDIVERVHGRVLQGMGFIALHSSHYAKPFKRLMGTSCSLKWREAGEKERVWITNPGHPIAQGLGPYFELPQTEMYGEPFAVPEPEEQVFISWFEGGEVFRSGNCYRRGNGKIFYFRPGHETYPIYHNPNVQRVIFNAVNWAAPTTQWTSILEAPNVPIEEAAESINGSS
ncbi:MAG: ThuA domain-containing protein [Verrucomicrobiota bacterium]